MRKFVPFILAFAFVLTCFIVSNVRTNSVETTLSEQREEISKLKNQITIKEASNESSQDDIVLNTTGYDGRRKVSDDKIATDFIKKCCNWSSYDEYMKARQQVIKDYKLDEKSKFLKVFMPAVNNIQTDDGTNYNKIDTFNYNCEFEELSSYVLDITKDGAYSYFSFVTISSRDKNGNEGTAVSVFTYTISNDGKISNINADVVS